MSRPTLPPGFRFHPTDGELVQYYLKRKVLGKPLRFEAISEIDIYKFAPWDLREKSCLKNRDLEWYFFCPRDKKYASGPRTNRTTEIGYWKTTGKDRTVRHNSQIVGMKKTLVFHTGRSPRGIRTDWVMHEYRLEDKDLATAGIFQGAYVLCRIFQKSGPGPRNGEQYGAPFREEDWEDDVNDPFSLPLADPGSPSILLDDDQNVSIVPGSAFGSSLEPIPCQAGPSNNTSDHTLPEDDDIVSLLALFGNEEEVLVSTSNVSSESPQSSNVGVAHLDGYGFYNSLEDIITLEELNKIHFPSSCLEAEYPLDQTHIWGSSSFLELKDLELPLEDPTVHGADNLFLDPLACNSNYDNIEGLPGPALPLALPALGLSRCNTLPEGSSIEEELAPFFKDNGNGANASGGQDALYNISSSSKNFQEGGKQQALARGSFHYPRCHSVVRNRHSCSDSCCTDEQSPIMRS
uniref:NAC domain-containing protein n=1 Tax=Nelumbo nucifera TaxID=4432 RepID=A0A822XU13_NELNU|nr:TPA_asm: hypothetical protein HUJ06_024124 [Nelumbo nucifera]